MPGVLINNFNNPQHPTAGLGSLYRRGLRPYGLTLAECGLGTGKTTFRYIRYQNMLVFGAMRIVPSTIKAESMYIFENC